MSKIIRDRYDAFQIVFYCFHFVGKFKGRNHETMKSEFWCHPRESNLSPFTCESQTKAMSYQVNLQDLSFSSHQNVDNVVNFHQVDRWSQRPTDIRKAQNDRFLAREPILGSKGCNR